MRIDPHAAYAAPHEDENAFPGIVSPFSKGGKGDLSFFPARSLRGASCATWQSLPST